MRKVRVKALKRALTRAWMATATVAGPSGRRVAIREPPSQTAFRRAKRAWVRHRRVPV